MPKTFDQFRTHNTNLTEQIEVPATITVFEAEIDEDAPTNSAGGGGVAGLGVGSQGEPGIKPKKLKIVGGPEVKPVQFADKVYRRVAEAENVAEPEHTFAGAKVFSVDPDTYYQCRLGKSRYHRWSKYVGDSEVGQAIRNFGKTSTDPIVVMNSQSGEMMYLRHNSLHNWKEKK